MESVTVVITKGATFPVTIACANYYALIDIGSSCTYMSETFYQHFLFQQVKQVFHISITSASGNTI